MVKRKKKRIYRKRIPYGMQNFEYVQVVACHVLS